MCEYGIIIDLDGTLMDKGMATKGSREFIEYLKLKDVPFRVITNSVGRTQEELAKAVEEVGIEIDKSLFLNPIKALDRYLIDNEIKSYYFVGPKKIEDSLSVKSEFIDFPDYIILSGLEEADYDLLNKLFNYLKQGSKLLTMSRSEYYIAVDGLKLDTGAFTRMLEFHSENEAILFGKPSAELFLAALTGMKLDIKKVLVIGDDVLTDIKGAKEFGLHTVLVKSGKYQDGDETLEKPDIILNDLNELILLLKSRKHKRY